MKFDGGVAIAADMLGSYGSLARYPGISRMVKINETTVLGASGDIADLQALKEELESMMIQNDIQDDGHQYTPEAISPSSACFSTIVGISSTLSGTPWLWPVTM